MGEAVLTISLGVAAGSLALIAFGGDSIVEIFASVVVVLLLHAYLVRKHLKAPYGDVRSGLFAALAEWAA